MGSDDDGPIGATQMEVDLASEDMDNVFVEQNEPMGDGELGDKPESDSKKDQPSAAEEDKTKGQPEQPVEPVAVITEVTAPAERAGEEEHHAEPQPEKKATAEAAPPPKPATPEARSEQAQEAEKSNDGAGGALFGDEDEGEEEEEEEEAEDADNAHMDSGEADWDQGGDQDMGGEEDDIVRILLETPKGQPDAGDKLMLVGLPTNVRLNMDIFEKDKCAEFESKIVKMGNVQELQDLKKELIGSDSTDMIFCKSDEPVPDKKEDVNLGSLHSTCKYVEFSDGTSAILIGQNAYTQIGSSDFSAVLLEVSQLPVMRVHGDLNQRRIYSFAPSTSNMRKSLMR